MPVMLDDAGEDAPDPARRQSPDRLIAVTLDEAGLAAATPEVEQERKIAIFDLLEDNPDPTEQEIREGLEGNLCRCTGYQNIVSAVQQVAGGERS